MGDAFKAAYPWIKKISQAAASDATSVGSASVQLVASMINSWEKYKNDFRDGAFTAFAIAKVDKPDADVVEKIYDAMDSAMDELKKGLPESNKLSEHRTFNDSVILDKHTLSELIRRAIS